MNKRECIIINGHLLDVEHLGFNPKQSNELIKKALEDKNVTHQSLYVKTTGHDRTAYSLDDLTRIHGLGYNDTRLWELIERDYTVFSIDSDWIAEGIDTPVYIRYNLVFALIRDIAEQDVEHGRNIQGLIFNELRRKNKGELAKFLENELSAIWHLIEKKTDTYLT